MTLSTTSAQLPSALGGFDLTDQARYADGVPYEVFARLRERAPILRHPPGQTADGEAFWVLSRHADIVAAAADPAFSAEGGGGRTGGGTHLDDLETGVHAGVLLGMMDDPRHDLIKRVARPAVNRGAMAALAPTLRSLAADLLDAALRRGDCEFAAEVSGPYGTRAVGTVLGVPAEDLPRLVAWTDVNSNVTDRGTGTVTERSHATGAAALDYCRHLVAAKQAAPGDDLGTALAVGDLPADAPGGPMTGYERALNTWLMLLTGSEQPRNTVAGAVLALAEHPEQWRLLRDDRSLLPSAVEELLRWAPPNPYNRRTVTHDLEFRGVPMVAGDKVTFWWPSANRDPAVFRDADTLDLRRTPNPHLSFGAGRHLCLGDHLAREELRAFLTELLDRVAEIRLTGPVRYLPSNKHTVVSSMPVTLVATGR